MRHTLSIALLAVFCFSLPIHAETTLQARVVEVQDGKTIIVENTGRRVRVVLKGIDTPELDQPMGDVARQHLANLVIGKQVAIKFTGMAYGSHFVAQVFSQEMDVSLQMIRDGVAWYDRRYENDMSAVDRSLYDGSEKAARSEHRGIWQDPSPTPPWEWRQAKAAKQNRWSASPTPNRRKPPVVSREDAKWKWPMYTPPGAPFSARIPGGGEQYSVEVQLPNGQVINADYYWAGHLKINYVAVWASGPNNPEAVSTLFERTLNDLNRSAAVRGLLCEFTRKKDTTFNGYIGQRYVIQGCYFHGGLRLYYKVEGQTLKICLVGALSADENDPSANQLLDSFVIP